jgi:PAS domain S-box-containing protein
MDILIVGTQLAQEHDLLEDLHNHGFSVIATVATPEEALSAISTPTVDLVIIGPTIATSAKAFANACNLSREWRAPLVCLVDSKEIEPIKETVASRCHGVLHTPVDPEQLQLTAALALHRYKESLLLIEQENRLGITLNSVADAVISSDNDGLVTFLNRAAERLTGHHSADVHLQHLRDVFRIVDAETRSPTKLNLAQCMASEDPVSLAEHFLINADGGLVPIDGSASPIRDPDGQVTGMVLAFRDITERKHREEELRHRNQELALLNRAGQAFSSSLDVDEVITAVLEEMRHVLGIVACSTWLLDQDTDELVCRAVTGPQSELVLNWRLAAGEGIAGYVASSGESLIVPDTLADERHFGSVDQETGLALRSILSVPLTVQNRVIGVVQAVDIEVNRFNLNDQRLVESMASSAAIAIDNAQLYERNRRLAVEQERHRLAHELHDSVTQALYSISLAAEASLKQLRDDDIDATVLKQIEHIQNLSKSSLVEMREQLYGMHASAMGEKRLIEALAQHCDILRGQYGLSIVIMSGPEPDMSDQTRNGLFAIAKEALWNVVKHAAANRVNVVISTNGETLTMSIVDNGVGFNPQEIPSGKTVGLSNMEERARMLGGSWKVTARPGSGTQINVVVPLESADGDTSDAAK